MKDKYLNEIKYAIKTREYWFTFGLIIISSAWTALYHLDRYGALYGTQIGAAEFFYASLMLGNTLMQISAPILPIFASGIIHKAPERDNHQRLTLVGVLSVVSISASVFILSYILIATIGVLIFGASTGDLEAFSGLYRKILQTPFFIIPLKTFHSCIFAGVYSILGMGISVNLKKNKALALIIPLIFYFCFQYVLEIIPLSISNILYWICPQETFAIADVSILKNAIELIFVLLIGVLLIFIAKQKEEKYNKESKML